MESGGAATRRAWDQLKVHFTLGIRPCVLPNQTKHCDFASTFWPLNEASEPYPYPIHMTNQFLIEWQKRDISQSLDIVSAF
jgi:hypothetical protein